jgi:hypothetical protein
MEQKGRVGEERTSKRDFAKIMAFAASSSR